MDLSATACLLLAAMLFDAVIGDPRWLYRIVPHPTVVMGRVLSFCDRRFNRPSFSATGRRVAGAVSTVAIVVTFGVLGALISVGLSHWQSGFWVEALLVSVLIAQNSLYRHVADVTGALERDGVEAGRSAVAHIVGRDPESLDGHGVTRSAVESLAENFGDGVVAPVLWGLILGLPGIVAYKALNTADSMIGHLDHRYREFGGPPRGWTMWPTGCPRASPVSCWRYRVSNGAPAARGTPWRSCGGMAAPIARSTRVIPRHPWPARWACAWPARGDTRGL